MARQGPDADTQELMRRAVKSRQTSICAFVYVFHLHRDVILFGGSFRYTVRDGVSMLRENFASPCLRIQHGCKCEIVS